MDGSAACLLGADCLLVLYTVHTVHTHCKQAHHHSPPLCDCDAESQATPTCDNTTQHIPSPTERIRYRTRAAAFRICAILGAHHEHFTVESGRIVPGVATTRQAHCLATASGARSQGVEQATPNLHEGALKEWHEYNKEIKSKVIRCECPENTGSANADSRAELPEFGRPSRGQRCHSLVLEGDGCGLFDNDTGRVCLLERYVPLRQQSHVKLTHVHRFLMLPATFVDVSTLRVNQTAVGIFGIAILTGGFAFSALLTFTIRNPLFQAETIHQPCALASGVGLLTVFYNFIISSSYHWKTSTLLLAIAAGVSTIVYTGLLLLSLRRVSHVRSHPPQASSSLPLTMSSPGRTSFASPATTYEPSTLAPSERTSSYQPSGYYENYIRNMYPTSTRAPEPNPTDLGFDPGSISEEEMQRQQMLMLLLANESPDHQRQQSTFHIDWQGEGDDSPAHGYYAPGVATNSSIETGTGTGGSWPSPAPPPEQSTARRWTRGALRPWDGVWRGVARREEQQQQQIQQPQQQPNPMGREERRREIELGLR